MKAKTIRTVQFAELIEFVAVVEYRSFTRAAAELRVPTATLSQAIRAVEGRLGMRLLNWTTRRVAPTPVGECLLEKLRAILKDLESSLEEARTSDPLLSIDQWRIIQGSPLLEASNNGPAVGAEPAILMIDMIVGKER